MSDLDSSVSVMYVYITDDVTNETLLKHATSVSASRPSYMYVLMRDVALVTWDVVMVMWDVAVVTDVAILKVLCTLIADTVLCIVNLFGITCVKYRRVLSLSVKLMLGVAEDSDR